MREPIQQWLCSVVYSVLCAANLMTAFELSIKETVNLALALLVFAYLIKD